LPELRAGKLDKKKDAKYGGGDVLGRRGVIGFLEAIEKERARSSGIARKKSRVNFYRGKR